MFETLKKGLEIRHIRSTIIEINKHIEEKKIRAIDISILIRYIDNLKDLLEKTPAEIGHIKNFCSGLKKAFYRSIKWRNIHLLREASVHTINMFAISDSVISDPGKARMKYGDISTIRLNLLDSLKNLADALTVVLNRIKTSKKEKNNKAA
ncbi:hypothetical protein GF336_07620 [Candidatus Woesearchaeota archaeon]|nr:hypothetical protein [Candidatus Woesearchaeota archaeon]